MNVCPKNAIKMTADCEGFLYPQIDKSLCIDCSLCSKVCPVINVKEDTPFQQKAYLVQNKDEKVRSESTAGGAFTAIADYVISKNGTVFGAGYDENFRVYHNGVKNKDQLFRFRNSKYVQSDTETTFSEVKSLLEKGEYVCYSGTPCQIEGLLAFLRKDYPRLITVDVVCRAVPSALVWEKYLEMQKEKYGSDISNILFRDKRYGYKYSALTLKNNENKRIYSYGIDTDPMLRAFFSNICDRPSCYECKFKKRYRVSDLTLWDCFAVSKFDKKLDDDKGTTRMLIHTEKGRQVFEDIKEAFTYAAVDADEVVKDVNEMLHCVTMNPKREQFFYDIDLPGNKLFNKYFPITFRTRFERTARLVCNKLGIYNLAKNVAKKILKK